MALKKSELYSSLWASCDELRGGMDASQYKDYVLVLLFIKYISDKYAGQPYAPITIPRGRQLQGHGRAQGQARHRRPDQQEDHRPAGQRQPAAFRSDFPDFNDPAKLGSGKEKVERLTNLIAIFENPALDFSKNRAEGDDILGDAYEYLMRHFATESGKSKGQFYTPAEVSRVMAQILGIRKARTTSATTVYDPTCGSGSLLLKVGDEAGTAVTLYGQEKDAATSGLARMNMILHNNPTALIMQGNTLTDPKFKDGDTLKTFDYVVANFALQRQALEHRPRPAQRPLRALQALRHAARQAGRLRLPAAHRPLAQEHRQGRVHPAARRALPRQRRGRHPPHPGAQGLHQGHHRPAAEPLLRHRHPCLHRRPRQGGRPRPQGHLHDRRQRAAS